MFLASPLCWCILNVLNLEVIDGLDFIRFYSCIWFYDVADLILFLSCINREKKILLQTRKTFLTLPLCDSCKQRLLQGFRYGTCLKLLINSPKWMGQLCKVTPSYNTRNPDKGMIIIVEEWSWDPNYSHHVMSWEKTLFVTFFVQSGVYYVIKALSFFYCRCQICGYKFHQRCAANVPTICDRAVVGWVFLFQFSEFLLWCVL